MAILAIACPASFLGEFHHAAYDNGRGVWKCRHCGLGGNAEGLAKLTKLEAKCYELEGELEIAKFEAELAERERRAVA